MFGIALEFALRALRGVGGDPEVLEEPHPAVRDAILERTGNVRLVAVGNTGRWRSFFTAKKPIAARLRPRRR